MGVYFKERLTELQKKFPDEIKEIRGAGLLIGIELREDIAKAVSKKLFDDGILVSLCAGTTIRIAPPLIVSKNDVNMFTAELSTAIKSMIM